MKAAVLGVILTQGFGMDHRVVNQLTPMAGEPMMFYPLSACFGLAKEEKVIFFGNIQKEQLKSIFKTKHIELLGIAEDLSVFNTLLVTQEAFKKFDVPILIIPGNIALLEQGTLKKFVSLHTRNNNSFSILSAFADNPAGCSRILRDSSGQAYQIISERDASKEQKAVHEIFSGICCISSNFLLSSIKDIKYNHDIGEDMMETFLTDLYTVATIKKIKSASYCIGSKELIRIKTARDIGYAQEVIKKRIVSKFLDRGIRIVDPDNTYIERDVKIGVGTVIHPWVEIRGKTIIGKNCEIKSFSMIENEIIKDNSILERGTNKIIHNVPLKDKEEVQMKRKYDVVLSFAGEDRLHAKKLADLLRQDKLSVFYDDYEDYDLWGKNLYDHLSEIYGSNGKYCVMFLSKHYSDKQWPTWERKNAQERAFKENKEYILPIRVDDTKVTGILDTVSYLDLRVKTIEEIYNILKKKLSSSKIKVKPKK